MREVRSENRLGNDVFWDAHLTSSLFLLILCPSLTREKNGFPLHGIAWQEKNLCQLPWEPKKRGSRLLSTPTHAAPGGSLSSPQQPAPPLPLSICPTPWPEATHIYSFSSSFSFHTPGSINGFWRKHLFVKESYISTQQTKKLKHFIQQFFRNDPFLSQGQTKLISFEIQMKLPRTC